MLRIATFNLRYGTAEDGENHWGFRHKAALAMIERCDADAMGLQEVLDFQLCEILESLSRYRATGVARDDGANLGEQAPILYDPQKLTLEDSGTFWFSETPEVPGSKHADCYHPRICTWARFDRFILYNLHLDNESGSSRLKSVRQLGRTLASASLPLIVTGDFNASETEDSIDAMRALGLRDSFRELRPNAAAPTFHGFGKHETPDKIDPIWIDRHWEAIAAEIDRSHVDGRWPSDHYPVLASLRLRS